MSPRSAARFVFSIVAAVATTLAASAAEPGPEAVDVRAERIFRVGRELMRQGKYDEACSRFEESQALLPAAGTLLNLAVCREEQGRLATAWALYRQSLLLAADAGAVARIVFIESRIDALRDDVPHVSLEVPAVSQVPGLVLKRNGEVVPAARWGEPVAVDVGTMAIEASAPNHAPWRLDLQVRRGADLTIRIPTLVEVAKPDPPRAVEPQEKKPPAREVAPSLPREQDASSTTLATTAWVGGALGIVSIGVGTYFGVKAVQNHDESDAYCRDGGWCRPEGVELNEQAYDNARRSNAFLGAGVALTAVSAVVLWTSAESGDAPRGEPDVAVSAEIRGADARVQITW